MNCLDHVHSLAKRNRRRIALPEPADLRVIEAAERLTRLGLAEPVLVGPPQHIRKAAKDAGLRVPDVEIVDPTADEKLDAYVERLVELRAGKGMTSTKASELLRSPIYFAAMMVDRGDADGVVAGCITATAEVVRTCIRVIRPAEGMSTVSSCSIIVPAGHQVGEEDTLIFADTGVVPDPTSEQLAEIAVSTAGTYQALFDTEPRVAMISFSTKSSASHPLIQKVKRAVYIAKRLEPNLSIDGELQVDAALIPEVARRKVNQSDVAGRANILVFPNLDAGNAAYKLAERLGGARALGPLLQGLRKPASDLSRGCSSRDIVDAAAIVGVQAAK